AQLTAAGIVPATGGTFTGLVSFTGGATFDGTPTQDLATLNSLGIQGAHNNNLWENSSFAAFPAGAGTYADGALGFPRTSVLCDTGSVTLAQVQQPQDGVPYAMRITQPDAGAKRIGFVQQLTAANTYFYRGQQLVMVPKLRCSVATTLRVALVAFTGTADTAPADVVNNWASTTYTAGNFFIANTSTIAVTATAVSAATFTDCLASSTSAGGVVAPSTMNNLYMVVWTDTAQAQNVTLDAADVQVCAGTVKPLWYPNDPSIVGRLLNVQVFTASGTYTPTPGTTRIIVEGQGSGGAGGGSVATAAGQVSVGAGGGAGGRSKTLLTTGFYPTVTVTIGAGGAPAGGGAGGAGGNSTFGAFMTCNGGAGGGASGSAVVAGANGGAGGTVSGGTIFNIPGATGANGLAAFAGAIAVSGAGGDSAFGSGAPAVGVAVNGGAVATAGVNSNSTGSGGSGGVGGAGGGATSGGGGSAGAFIVYEYA
ncbi:MAG TPA: hypothetical protein VJ889_20225, partial [Pseudomonas sp.]|nr:hypothetical protein [Pseudomonas sp.]